MNKRFTFKGHTHTQETKDSISESCKGMLCEQSTKDKLSVSLKGRIFSEQHKQNLSTGHLGHIVTQETRDKVSIGNKGKKRSIETKAKISIAKKEQWKDPQYVRDLLSKVLRANKVRPNKAERLLRDILNDLFPGCWKYVGDGQFTIGTKCPDFVNINGHKQIIELFGDYWHKGQDPQLRIDLFADYGYSTMIVWESELEDISTLTKKLSTFDGGIPW
jgi:hypothetical protein